MKGDPTSPGPRYRALIELLRTAEVLWNASRIFFARWDLSPSQFNILNVLHEHPAGCTQVELSRQLIMHRSNVTGLVDRLEARGFVRRAGSLDDRRVFVVGLTPAGNKLLRQILPHYYQAAETVWNDVPIERAHQLLSELAAVSATAEKISRVQSAGPKLRRGKIAMPTLNPGMLNEPT